MKLAIQYVPLNIVHTTYTNDPLKNVVSNTVFQIPTFNHISYTLYYFSHFMHKISHFKYDILYFVADICFQGLKIFYVNISYLI